MYKLAPRFFLGLSLGVASLVGAVAISGCHKGVEPAAIPDNSGPDPADANMAPVDNSQPQPAPPRTCQGQSPWRSFPVAAPAELRAVRASPPPQNEAYTAARPLSPRQSTITTATTLRRR